MDWDKLRVFHAVADAGSLTHAGDQLHLSQSAISRQIRGLEEQVGATLVDERPGYIEGLSRLHALRSRAGQHDLARITGELLEAFGRFWVAYSTEHGYERLYRAKMAEMRAYSGAFA